MLHTRLLEIINSRQAWAFVGSGASTDAGAASWSALIDAALAEPEAAALPREPAFRGAKVSGNYPRCFTLLEQALGRPRLEQVVRKATGSIREPSDLHRLLADLPFQGYITTNYDDLLELALSEREPGWTSVGNLGDEPRKVSGDASRVVWHTHGSLMLPPEASRLILTTQDYDSLYLDDSDVARQLRSLMSQKRIIVVGFGFGDQEVLRLLRRVGRMTDATRPIFAFLPKRKDFSTTVGRKLWLHECNVDIVPYKIRADSHRALKDLLTVYASLALRRSLRYKGNGATPPSYDPETTGLLIYNELVLARGIEVSSDLRSALLRARVMAQLHDGASRTAEALSDGVLDSARRLGQRVLGVLSEDGARDAIAASLSELEASGLVVLDSTTGTYALSDAGVAEVVDHAAVASRLEAQFRSSIDTRAREACNDSTVAPRVATAAEAFLKNCIEKRALGVAMALTLKQAAQQEYHLLALLQALGDYLETLEDEEEARCLLEVIQSVLRAPSAAEKEYIGVTLQARFGVHLLGYDDVTLATRLADVHETCFIIDSTALIGLLARSSPNGDMAITLLRELASCDAMVMTTPMLAKEVSDHVLWAQARVVEGGGSFQSLPLLEAATGRGGQRSNAFIEGFAVEMSDGRTASFTEYIREVCDLHGSATQANQRDVFAALAKRGVPTYRIDQLDGFKPEMRRELESHQARLQQLRETAETFTREAQVEAEAEALGIVEGIRDSRLSFPSRPCSHAYFISNTRIIELVANADVPVTMKPEAAVQWLATLHPCSREDLGTLTSGLLWELQERGLDIIDTRTLLSAFSPLIEASERAREAEVARLRTLTGNVYAGAAEGLESDIPSLDLPVVMESYNAQRVRELQQALEEEKRRTANVTQGAALNEDERQELERLRDKERKRVKYNRRMGRRKDK